MKQLIHSYGSSLAFALGHRAFVYSTDHSLLKELKIPQASQDTKADTTSTGIQIQALAVHDDLICVALHNKRLLMFLGVLGGKECCRLVANDMTEKRVTKLAFARLNEEEIEDTDNLVLLATDMVGDATAYQIPSSFNTQRINRKLLLGHTASVLTDMCLITTTLPSSSTNPTTTTTTTRYLLTADRDEKIRISHFPRCYDIYGYLLAHTAFVTSVSAIVDSNSQSTTMVASVGGDGQLILWNIQTCEKITSCRVGGDDTIPTKLLAVPNSQLLLAIGDKDCKLYGFTYNDQHTLKSIDEPFIFASVPVDVACYCCPADGTTTLAVLFQESPYVRCFKYAILNGTTLKLTETTSEHLKQALLSLIPSDTADVKIPESLLERRREHGIVLAKHARDSTEYLPNDPDRLPGQKEKIVQRHEKKKQKKTIAK